MEGKAGMFDVRFGLVMTIYCSVIITPLVCTAMFLQIECVMWETIKRPNVGGYTFRMIHGAYNMCLLSHLFMYWFCNCSEQFDFLLFTFVLTFQA